MSNYVIDNFVTRGRKVLFRCHTANNKYGTLAQTKCSVHDIDHASIMSQESESASIESALDKLRFCQNKQIHLTRRSLVVNCWA